MMCLCWNQSTRFRCLSIPTMCPAMYPPLHPSPLLHWGSTLHPLVVSTVPVIPIINHNFLSSPSTDLAFLVAPSPFIDPHFHRLMTPHRPGDYLKPGEDEFDGLKRRLDERLAPPGDSMQFNSTHGVDNEWEIGDCLAQWWRPNFETFMVRYQSFLSVVDDR
jgi:hypothetical protein